MFPLTIFGIAMLVTGIKFARNADPQRLSLIRALTTTIVFCMIIGVASGPRIDGEVRRQSCPRPRRIRCLISAGICGDDDERHARRIVCRPDLDPRRVRCSSHAEGKRLMKKLASFRCLVAPSLSLLAPRHRRRPSPHPRRRSSADDQQSLCVANMTNARANARTTTSQRSSTRARKHDMPPGIADEVEDGSRRRDRAGEGRNGRPTRRTPNIDASGASR